MSEPFGGDEQIVDFERRKKNAEYTLGDPTAFPVEFLAWLPRFIEQIGLKLPISSVIGGFRPGSSSLRNMAPGMILAFAGPTPPSGCLRCDGQSVSRTEYGLLFAVIGTFWGSADGSSFNVPDLRGRMLVGIGSALALAQTDLLPEAERGPHHRHTVTDPGHTHPINNPDAIGADKWSHNWHRADNLDQADPNTDIRLAQTGISVGPAGKPLDAPAHAAVMNVITTGT